MREIEVNLTLQFKMSESGLNVNGVAPFSWAYAMPMPGFPLLY
jgi:hypothetical protein